MCQYVDSQYIAPGWGCCHCYIPGPDSGMLYNGMQRAVCRDCKVQRCSVLEPDKSTGKVFENRENHKDFYERFPFPGIQPAVIR